MDYILYVILSDKVKISKLYYIPSFCPYEYDRVDLLLLDDAMIDKYKKHNLLCNTADEAKALADKILYKIDKVEIGA